MVRSLLRRDPEERLTSEDILLHPWLREDTARREMLLRSKPKIPLDDHCVPEFNATPQRTDSSDLMEMEEEAQSEDYPGWGEAQRF